MEFHEYRSLAIKECVRNAMDAFSATSDYGVRAGTGPDMTAMG